MAVRPDRPDTHGTVFNCEQYNKTPAQVLVRWGLQHDFVSLPKSDHQERIVENAEVYDFAAEADAMKRRVGLDQGASGACSWNPVDVA